MRNDKTSIIVNCLIALIFGTGVFLWCMAMDSLTSAGSYGFVYQLSEDAGETVGVVLMLVGTAFNLLTIMDVRKLWIKNKK